MCYSLSYEVRKKVFLISIFFSQNMWYRVLCAEEKCLWWYEFFYMCSKVIPFNNIVLLKVESPPHFRHRYPIRCFRVQCSKSLCFEINHYVLQNDSHFFKSKSKTQC